jgi:hypothetical protein
VVIITVTGAPIIITLLFVCGKIVERAMHPRKVTVWTGCKAMTNARVLKTRRSGWGIIK